jgi:hypothetical protein
MFQTLITTRMIAQKMCSDPCFSDGVWAPHWYAHVWESTGFEVAVVREVELSGKAAEVAENCRGLYEKLHGLRMAIGRK